MVDILFRMRSRLLSGGLREEIIRTTSLTVAQTLVLDPFRDQSLIHPFEVRTLNVQEAYAEKVRAALSRNVPAIRDLFDLDFALRENRINFLDGEFQKLVALKLGIPGNGPVKLDDGRKLELLAQIETELRPVLRPRDFGEFDFNRAWERLLSIHDAMKDQL